MYLSFFLTYSTPPFPPPSIVYSLVHRTETIRERNEHSERTCLPPLCSHLIIWSRATRCECVCSQNADRQLEFRLAANVNCLIVYKYFNTKLTNFYTSFSRCLQINILNYMLWTIIIHLLKVTDYYYYLWFSFKLIILFC